MIKLDFIISEWIPQKSSGQAGKAYGGLWKGKFYSILLTYAGAYRGNHLHRIKQSTILLNGKARYIIKKDNELINIPLKIGKQINIKAGVPHILLAEEDTLTLEWWEGEWREEPYKVIEIDKE